MTGRTQINIEANKKLDETYKEKGITECEIQLFGCWHSNHTHYAHRHKRLWYYSRPELLSSFKETVKACDHCHSKIEYDKDLTEKIFVKLRDEPYIKENFRNPKGADPRPKVETQSFSGLPGELTAAQLFAITDNIGKEFGLSKEQHEKLIHLSKESASRIIYESKNARTRQEKQEVYNKLERMLTRI